MSVTCWTLTAVRRALRERRYRHRDRRRTRRELLRHLEPPLTHPRKARRTDERRARPPRPPGRVGVAGAADPDMKVPSSSSSVFRGRGGGWAREPAGVPRVYQRDGRLCAPAVAHARVTSWPRLQPMTWSPDSGGSMPSAMTRVFRQPSPPLPVTPPLPKVGLYSSRRSRRSRERTNGTRRFVDGRVHSTTNGCGPTSPRGLDSARNTRRDLRVGRCRPTLFE